MKDLERLELVTSLVLLSDPSLTDDEIIQTVLKEFEMVITQEDLNVLYASYTPDNFETESRLMEYYGTFNNY
ncbi:MAG: hypothetical protein ACOC3V_00885 [bacterium]